MIDIFAKLGKRVLSGAPKPILECATQQNRWFTEREINLAIEAICETMLNRELLENWIAQYPTLPLKKGEKVLIVMAGNIPLVGLFDLLCVLMAGHTALIKPSHKDEVLTKWIVDTLKEIEPTIPIYTIDSQDNVDAKSSEIDRVIATGSDTAALHFRSMYSGKKLLLRGSRHSIAILNGEESKSDLEKLAKDIYTYSGLGCRSISMIFVPKGYNLRKITFCGYEINEKFRNNYTQNRALLKMSNAKFFDNGASCIMYSDQFPQQLSSISIYEYNNIAEVEEWIKKHNNEIQCVATNIEHITAVKLGKTQYPTLNDYADGVDTMIFLS